MNYQKIYNNLILKRRTQVIDKKYCYCECHHILPKSLGGSNEDSNLINLTAREHYIAHLLLVKIALEKYGRDSTQYQKMIRAVTYFQTYKTNNKLEKRKILNFNSKNYEKIRKEFGIISKTHMKGLLVGKRNGMYGRKRTEEEKLKISMTRKLRGCGVGEKNAMYRVNARDLMDPEKLKEADEKRRKFFTGRVHLYNLELKKNVLVKKNEVADYLKLGYKYGQKNFNGKKSLKGRIYVCHMERKINVLLKENENPEPYLRDGFIYGRYQFQKKKHV